MMKYIKDPEDMDVAVAQKHLTEEGAEEIAAYFEKRRAARKAQEQGIIEEPDGIDFTVIPKHLTDEEAAEISAYIQQYKARRQAPPVTVKVTAANPKELEQLLAFFQKLNVKWTLAGG